MSKWGWMLVSVGCIVVMYSQANGYSNETIFPLILGLALALIGGIIALGKTKRK